MVSGFLGFEACGIHSNWANHFWQPYPALGVVSLINDQCLSSLALKVLIDGAQTTWDGRLFQSLVIHDANENLWTLDCANNFWILNELPLVELSISMKKFLGSASAPPWNSWYTWIILPLWSMKYEVWCVIGLCIGSQFWMSKKYQVNLFLFIRKFQIHIEVFWSSVFMAHIWKKVQFHQISIVLVEMVEQVVGTAST